jgi:hypothetical protein
MTSAEAKSGRRTKKRGRTRARPRIASISQSVGQAESKGRYSIGSELIRSHPIRHDRTREHGHSPTPAVDRSRQCRLTLTGVSPRYRSRSVARVRNLTIAEGEDV